MWPVIKIGNVFIPTYGLIAVASFLFTYWFIKVYAVQEKFGISRARDVYLYSAIAGLAGSKLLSIAIEFPLILQDPKHLKVILVSGGVFYGGLLSGILCIVLYAIYNKINIFQILDMVIPIAALLTAIDRWGCLASGCCYGKPTDVPWAITFTNPIAHAMHPDLPSVPIHPTQIYLSLNSLIIFFILHMLYKRKRFHGQIFFSYLLLYGIGRFFIEYYRYDYRGIMFGGFLSTSQLIALLTSALSACAILYFVKKRIYYKD